ncbi:hypothetical protein XBJ2_840004 [Xenorhabdus bovienii str. Jollieti]|uniref:Uncharacterized protein n=1 Tax=Xenorhabdus bovienii (strain SS-2004) TaxID=406818 RepID=D3V0M1_XENBS|nr:hypothetical protein XBJ1_1543 [Xenorhabdus bovienii SS-2004]CDH30412.1 hypothetical protein XBJ2_840004 [Xenorhabdus bovienii str. Jollieti]
MNDFAFSKNINNTGDNPINIEYIIIMEMIVSPIVVGFESVDS